MISEVSGPRGSIVTGSKAQNEKMAINVMLVDDHACFRQALAHLLDLSPGIRTVTQARTLRDARRLLTVDVDLAVVDLSLPDGSGTDLVEDVRALDPKNLVLVLVDGSDPEESSRAAKAGASEILHKSVSVNRILGAVRRLGRSSNGRPASRSLVLAHGTTRSPRSAYQTKQGGLPVVKVAERVRRRRASAETAIRVPSREVHLHYPIARDGEGVLNLLCVPLETHGEALVVFSSREVARDLLLSGALPGECETRMCSGGELVSLLFGPYKKVRWVLLDPSARHLEGGSAGANLVRREGFVDHLLGKPMPTGQS